MSKLKLVFSLILISFIFISVSGCSPKVASASEAVAEFAQEATPTTAPESVPTETDQPGSDEAATDGNPQGDGVSDEGLVEDVEPDYCLDCHSDQDRLIAVAEKEEAVESESEGEG
ncbi:MAG: hypothetical protein HN929_11080 [Chloroflexi bacterium]|nr:hypothetical protein [Chloroflexota bacterium]